MSEELTVLQTLSAYLQPVFDLLIYAVGLLDALPGYIRALLTAILLVWLLTRLEREIKANETRFAELFRKSAFFALATIPLIVLLFPGIRMVVYAEVLPSISSPTQYLWPALFAIWNLGALLSLYRLYQAHRQARAEQQPLARLAPESKLHTRLQHWQRRLGNHADIGLCFSNTQRPWHSQTGQRLIGLPNAAEHWPAPIQDLLLLHELCHYQKKSPRWHLGSQIIACAYWPFPWVRQLQAKLDDSLQLTADELSEACYRDPMGYARGLRQIDQRLGLPKRSKPKPQEEEALNAWSKIRHFIANTKLGFQGYLAAVKEMAHPQALPNWDITELLERREQRELAERHSDPYDRALLLVGQAVFLAVVLTGTTLRPIPPEIDLFERYAQEYRMIENFHRSLEANEAKREPGGDETAANVSEPVALPKSSS